MSRQRIIIDTDPGLDDALTILFALASHEVHIEAITTVYGNVGIDCTTRNALAILELAGRTDIPVARGCSHSLAGQTVDASHVHGKNGIGNVDLPEPQQIPVAQSASEIIAGTLADSPGEITIVAIGPLTNLAEALRRHPEVASYAREIVIMGGALHVPGNVTPEAEFNIFADPQAAHTVFHAGWPIRLVSLDVTRKAQISRNQITELASNGNPVTRFISQMLAYYFDVYGASRKLMSFPMHDPLCFSAVIQPSLIVWQQAFVDVELDHSQSPGKTVMKDQETDPNMLVSASVDSERFITFYLERMQKKFSS